MKRILVIVALVLVISTSLIAGTLSLYTMTIPALAEGSVVAKEFVLLEGATNTFAENVKIAPGEIVEWDFSVKNFNGGIVSETAMDLDFTVELDADSEKDVIAPLEVTVKDEDGVTVGTKTGSGSIEFTDEFALDEEGQEKTYTVEINWPSNDAIDIDYAGADFGTAVKVSVTGTQQ